MGANGMNSVRKERDIRSESEGRVNKGTKINFRRVYLFPRGNGCDNLSVYLDYVSYRHKGSYDAHFSIEALDRLDPTISVKRGKSQAERWPLSWVLIL